MKELTIFAAETKQRDSDKRYLLLFMPWFPLKSKT